MMSCLLPLLLLALSAQAAPTDTFDDYAVATQKRAALVLDRLLVALQKALHEDSAPRRYMRLDRDGPRAAPLRIADIDDRVMMEPSREDGNMVPYGQASYGRRYSAPERRASAEDNMSALQRRGPTSTERGRVLRCFFNVVTCF